MKKQIITMKKTNHHYENTNHNHNEKQSSSL
jgi:hypothetical protein